MDNQNALKAIQALSAQLALTNQCLSEMQKDLTLLKDQAVESGILIASAAGMNKSQARLAVKNWVNS